MKNKYKILLLILMSVFLVGLVSANNVTEFSRRVLLSDLGNGNIVQFNVTYDGDMNSDFSDIRFYENNSQTFLSYWIEDNVNSDHIRVRLKTNSSNVVYLYYGNSTKTSQSSIQNVLGNGLVSFWRFEGNLTDELGLNHLTSGGSPTLTNAEFGKGYYFDGVDDNVYKLPANFSIGATGRTFYINVLINSTIASDCGLMGLSSDQGSPRVFYQLVPQPNGIDVNFASYGDDGNIGNYTTNSFNSFMIGNEDNGTLIYGLINGTNKNKTLGGLLSLTNSDFRIMRYTHTTSYCRGVVDEAGVFDDLISPSDMYSLYNMESVIASFGSEETAIYPYITIGLNSPQNYQNLTSSNVSFNCSVISNLTIENVTLYINGIANTTLIDGINLETELFTTLNMEDGDYNYTCDARDNSNFLGTTNTYYFNVNTYVPPIVEEEETSGDIIYNAMNGVGAGLGIIISVIAIPLFILIIGLVFVVLIYSVGMAIVPKLKNAIKF